MKLLILGTEILAVNVQESETAWHNDEQVIHKHVLPDAEVVEAMLPENYTPGGWRWNGSAIVPKPAEPAPVTEALIRSYDGHVQARLDAVARDFDYGDPNRPEVSPILHAISYADEPAVPKFQAEGSLLRAWRSLYWAACWPILEAVRLGQRPVPEPAALIAELDQAAPPPTTEEVNAKIAELTA